MAIYYCFGGHIHIYVNRYRITTRLFLVWDSDPKCPLYFSFLLYVRLAVNCPLSAREAKFTWHRPCHELVDKLDEEIATHPWALQVWLPAWADETDQKGRWAPSQIQWLWSWAVEGEKYNSGNLNSDHQFVFHRTFWPSTPVPLSFGIIFEPQLWPFPFLLLYSLTLIWPDPEGRNPWKVRLLDGSVKMLHRTSWHLLQFWEVILCRDQVQTLVLWLLSSLEGTQIIRVVIAA